MRAVIQAVSSASVRVEGGEPRAIGPGIMILLGVRDTDTLDIVPKLADKCAGLRIFPDAEGKLNLSARDLGYSALVVSQFTLYGDTKKGYRPSFIKAAKPPLSVDAYELFLAEMAKHGLKDVQHGEFGAHMQVSLVNEGPCTIIIDTDEWKKKEYPCKVFTFLRHRRCIPTPFRSSPMQAMPWSSTRRQRCTATTKS